MQLILTTTITLESSLDSKDNKPVNPKGNQPWIFIGRTDTEAEAPIIWPPDAKSQLTGKTLMLGKIEGKRKRGWQRMRWFDGITDSMDMNLSKLRETVKDREACHAAVDRFSKSRTWLSDWTTTTITAAIGATTTMLGFPPSSVGKESACNAGDPGSIPGSGRSTGEGIGYPLQYPWASLVAQLVKNLPVMWETWLWSLSWEDPLERESLPIPVFWLGEFHGLYSPWGHKESDTTEWFSLTHSLSHHNYCYHHY